MPPEPRHVVAFSGGKDSSALAVYLHDPARWRRALGKTGLPERAPLLDPEYVFCDTGTELDESCAPVMAGHRGFDAAKAGGLR